MSENNEREDSQLEGALGELGETHEEYPPELLEERRRKFVNAVQRTSRKKKPCSMFVFAVVLIIILIASLACRSGAPNSTTVIGKYYLDGIYYLDVSVCFVMIPSGNISCKTQRIEVDMACWYAQVINNPMEPCKATAIP